MTLAVKVELNPNTTNQLIPKGVRRCLSYIAAAGAIIHAFLEFFYQYSSQYSLQATCSFPT